MPQKLVTHFDPATQGLEFTAGLKTYSIPAGTVPVSKSGSVLKYRVINGDGEIVAVTMDNRTGRLVLIDSKANIGSWDTTVMPGYGFIILDTLDTYSEAGLYLATLQSNKAGTVFKY